MLSQPFCKRCEMKTRRRERRLLEVFQNRSRVFTELYRRSRW